jgi:hypothetical protein
LPGMPPDRRADIQVNDFPSLGETTVFHLTVKAVLKGDGDVVPAHKKGEPGSVAASAVKDKRESYKNLRGANLVVMAHEQFGRLNVEADELLRQLAHWETALRLELGPDDPREANPSYAAVFGAVLLRSRRMLSVGLAQQHAEAVIRGDKGATLNTEPAARRWRTCSWWTPRSLCRRVAVLELVMEVVLMEEIVLSSLIVLRLMIGAL